MANDEYASTSSVFRAILRIIHENELLPSNHIQECSAHESVFCAERRDGFNNTHCMDHSSYLDWNKCVSNVCEYI